MKQLNDEQKQTLVELRDNYPQLTFDIETDGNGWAYSRPNRDDMDEPTQLAYDRATAIIKEADGTEFQNFTVDGRVRFKYVWDHVTGFIGAGYETLEASEDQ